MNVNDKEFEKLILTCSTDLIKFARYLLPRNLADAEDLVQITYFKAWESRVKYRNIEGSNINKWLFKIMYNEFVNFSRKERVKNTRELLESVAGEGHIGLFARAEEKVDFCDMKFSDELSGAIKLVPKLFLIPL
ncbi:unnamed protein product, partial [marine sediment metagenome]